MTKKLITRFCILPISVFMLQSCTTFTDKVLTIDDYEGAKRPDSEVVTFFIGNQNTMNTQLRGQSSTRRARVLRSNPVPRYVMVRCMSGNRYGITHFTGDFKIGHYYNVQCEWVDQAKRTVKATYTEATPQQFAEERGGVLQ